jgi:hypothetical protein
VKQAWNIKQEFKVLSMSACFWQAKTELNIRSIIIPGRSAWTVPNLEIRRISCLLRLSLLLEMGQRARIFISADRKTITISHELPPILSTASKEFWGRGLVSIGLLDLDKDANYQLVAIARHFSNSGNHNVSDMKIRALIGNSSF